MYLKTLGIHVYLATIKDSYCLNGKHLEANSKALHALRSTLNNEYLSRVANFDSAFIVWNTIVSLGEQKQYYAGSDSDDGSDASNIWYIVQGDNPLEINSESELDEDVDMPYDELALFCQQILEKYDVLKKNNKRLKNKFECISKENKFLNVFLFSKLNDICEGNNSLKNKIIMVEKEKEIVLKENDFLKRKII